SVGDAFGERFFAPGDVIGPWLLGRTLSKPGPWRWTDDTAMALEVVDTLREHGGIDADALADRLLRRYRQEPWRGYGGGAHRLFDTIYGGVPWSEATRSLFGGEGSFGNGAAMRVAPVGAYLAEDLDAVVEAAQRSAVVTHAHPEGQAGAVAVAVAAAVAWQTRDEPEEDAEARLFDEVLARTPASWTRDGIEKARNTKRSARVETAAGRLGNGCEISSQDTVPLCIWCIARHLRSFEDAMWTTVAALGDRDTTCAIVGGVVALSAPPSTMPQAWRDAREPLEGLPLDELPLGQ
ncbi:MAG: ADP-ribosylglycohydrolase family protein, partial [Myxococcales bacterium]|nr:ADP-ribosylglycohydrolase family protein [Myxococcales bacterium]